MFQPKDPSRRCLVWCLRNQSSIHRITMSWWIWVLIVLAILVILFVLLAVFCVRSAGKAISDGLAETLDEYLKDML